MLERLICLAIGYVCGLFQTGYIYGRLHGIDIRDHGSGNAGTTNALRTLGTKAGVITFIGDCLKCIVAVLIMRLVLGQTAQNPIMLLTVYTCAGAILGHNYPFYLGFKGGKGIAATAGMIASCGWITIVVCLPIFVIVFVVTHYVSLGSLLVYVGLVVTLIVLGQTGYFQMDGAHLHEMYAVILILMALAFWKHRENIVRLLQGNERKTYLIKKDSKTQE